MIAPMPYFGGKSRIAPVVWRALGDVPNMVEPFFGSGAVLLARPDSHQWWDRTETANDADGMVANFWRALKAAPDDLAHHADWPVSEPDLSARHAWLVEHKADLVARLCGDPDYCDPKIAGWWLWGICAWIGGGWCSGAGPWHVVDGRLVNGAEGDGVSRQLPHLGDAGRGINRQLPHLGNAGMGINRQRPHLGDAGRGACEAWSEHLRDTMRALANRLRRVRVCCGDWARVCGPSPTTKLGLTGVFLDPPYSHEERDGTLYATESSTAAAECRTWAVEHGDDPLLRIALAGYSNEHDMPASWRTVEWKTKGGYGSQGDDRGRENAVRERLWLSPHCLDVEATAKQAELDFAGEESLDTAGEEP